MHLKWSGLSYLAEITSLGRVIKAVKQHNSLFETKLSDRIYVLRDWLSQDGDGLGVVNSSEGQ
jgi:hypothetical protein